MNVALFRNRDNFLKSSFIENLKNGMVVSNLLKLTHVSNYDNQIMCRILSNVFWEFEVRLHNKND